MAFMSATWRIFCLIVLLSVTTFALAEHPASFVSSATTKGIAEIENSKLALEKSNSSDIKLFARLMVSEFTAANKELSILAKNRHIPVLEDEELVSQAKTLVLKLRDNESFDAAYINNQIQMLQSTIEFFESESVSLEPNNDDFKGFANKMLNKLKGHLSTAQKLAVSHN
jgi:putative membrane protein